MQQASKHFDDYRWEIAPGGSFGSHTTLCQTRVPQEKGHDLHQLTLPSPGLATIDTFVSHSKGGASQAASLRAAQLTGTFAHAILPKLYGAWFQTHPTALGMRHWVVVLFRKLYECSDSTRICRDAEVLFHFARSLSRYFGMHLRLMTSQRQYAMHQSRTTNFCVLISPTDYGVCCQSNKQTLSFVKVQGTVQAFHMLCWWSTETDGIPKSRK